MERCVLCKALEFSEHNDAYLSINPRISLALTIIMVIGRTLKNQVIHYIIWHGLSNALEQWNIHGISHGCKVRRKNHQLIPDQKAALKV